MSNVADAPKLMSTVRHSFKSTAGMHPALTVSRVGTALVHDSSGMIVQVADNVPRVDYDPTTLQCLGLLVEGPTTNMLTDNCGFDIGWVKDGVTIEATNVDSPMVGMKAVRLRNTATSSMHWIQQNKPHTSGKRYFGSVFVKYEQGGAEWICFDYANYVNISNSGKSYFNAKTGEATGAPMQVIRYPNGWYRLIIQAMISTASNTEVFDPESGETVYIGDNQIRNTAPRIRLLEPGSLETYQGNTSQSMLIWGIQDEQSEAATMPIITGESQVTRGTEIVRLGRAGTSDLSFYLAANFSMLSPDTDSDANRRRNLINFNEPSSWINRVMLFISGKRMFFIGTEDTVHHNHPVKSVIPVDQNHNVKCSLACSYRGSDGDMRMSFNGENVTSINFALDASQLTQVTIGSQAGGIRHLNGHIEEITIIDETLSDIELQTISKMVM